MDPLNKREVAGLKTTRMAQGGHQEGSPIPLLTVGESSTLPLLIQHHYS